jgi:pyruvate kinase
VVALTPIRITCRRLAIVWGISPFKIIEYKNTEDIATIVEKELISRSIIESGNKYIITGGVPVGIPGTTNYLSIQRV